MSSPAPDRTRRRLTLALGAACATGVGAPAFGQASYPARPVRIIVPLAPGGGGDLLARFVAGHLSERLGASVVVDNRPGAGSILGTEIALKSQPDGYTLLMISSSYACSAATQQLPFDPIADIEPVALLTHEPLVLVGSPALKARNLADVVTEAKRAPLSLAYGSSGVGGISHLTGESFANAAGIKLNHVPYKGTGQALQDLMAGNIHLLFGAVAPVAAHVQSGRLIGLAIGGDRRAKSIPDVPTFAEAGWPDFKTRFWQALAGPKGMPPEVVARLNSDLNAIMKSEPAIARMEPDSSVAGDGPPEMLMKTIRTDIQIWKDLIARAGIKPQ